MVALTWMTLTLDIDFERFDAFHTKAILSSDEFRELDRFPGN
jgi:hypothetical protein